MNTNTVDSLEKSVRLIEAAKETGVNFYLRSGLKETKTEIVEIDKNKIIFNLNKTLNFKDKILNFYFLLDNYVYFGELLIKSSSNTSITTQSPALIYYRKDREYKRYHVKNKVYCQFKVISLMEQSEAESIASENLSFVLRNLFFELKKENPDIRKIVDIIKKEIRNICSTSDLKFYKKDFEFDEAEIILQNFKKTLFTENTDKIKSYINKSKSPFYITYGNSLSKESKEQGWEEGKIKAVAEKIQNEDIKKDRLSYIYIPLQAFEDIVGHIYLANDFKSKKIFEERDITYLSCLADIINLSLNKNKLFTADINDESKLMVENISLGGMMINVRDPYLLKFLKKDTRLSIKVDLDDKKINPIGKIVRIYQYAGIINIGVKFIELAPKDEKTLKHYLENIKPATK